MESYVRGGQHNGGHKMNNGHGDYFGYHGDLHVCKVSFHPCGDEREEDGGGLNTEDAGIHMTCGSHVAL